MGEDGWCVGGGCGLVVWWWWWFSVVWWWWFGSCTACGRGGEEVMLLW